MLVSYYKVISIQKRVRDWRKFLYERRTIGKEYKTVHVTISDLKKQSKFLLQYLAQASLLQSNYHFHIWNI